MTSRSLVEHGRISIAFEVRSRFDPRTGVERPIPPWVKDYDRACPPLAWIRDYDVRGWGLLAATSAGRPLGGAVLAWRTPGLDLMERRPERLVVWDLRVAPEARGQGVGVALWDAAEAWGRQRGARELIVETQDTNASACRFYLARGCAVHAVNADIYVDYPDELQILFTKPLAP